MNAVTNAAEFIVDVTSKHYIFSQISCHVHRDRVSNLVVCNFCHRALMKRPDAPLRFVDTTKYTQHRINYITFTLN